MELSRELLFFFSALGAFNGLVIGLYFLLVAKPRAASNYFLGLLLLALSIRIGKSVIYYFNPDLAGIYLQLGISGCLFIGPSL
ncbi:MAG: AraC family transcriptional regulator, partial [Bacteroidota bacterium]